MKEIKLQIFKNRKNSVAQKSQNSYPAHALYERNMAEKKKSKITNMRKQGVKPMHSHMKVPMLDNHASLAFVNYFPAFLYIEY